MPFDDWIHKATGVVTKAILSNERVAALAMKGASTPARIVVYCAYAIALISLVALAIPPYEASKQLGVLVVVAVALVVIAGGQKQRPRAPRFSEGSPPAGQLRTVQPSQIQLDVLRNVLEHSRRKAYEFLVANAPTLQDEQVRANVFVPVLEPSNDAEPSRLGIYPGLHFNMASPEIEIEFEFGQGATGTVYQTGRSLVAQRRQSAEGDWDAVYKMTPELAGIIHPELQWIISMPLKGTDGTPVGVLNIDGTGNPMPLDPLWACMSELTIFVISLGELIAKSATQAQED